MTFAGSGFWIPAFLMCKMAPCRDGKPSADRRTSMWLENRETLKTSRKGSIFVMKTIRKAISVLLLVILVLSAFTAWGKKETGDDDVD